MARFDSETEKLQAERSASECTIGMGNVHTAFALRDGTGATRNDGRTKKRRERRCSVERPARTRACGDRVAKKWRAGGGEAEKIRAVVRAFAYWRLRIGATFSACSTHQCRALLRHHRVANQP